MSRILPQCLTKDYSDLSAPADVLLREEPDEEEDEEDDEDDEGSVTDDEGEDDDEDNGGYSVQAVSSKQSRG
jgi:hypothetical protein